MPIKSDGLNFDLLTTDPSTPEDGQLWFNTTDGQYKIHYQDTTYILIDSGNQNLIDHTLIQNRGSHTHLELDGHVDSQSNPHVVTAEQVGNDVAQWNANRLQGNNVAVTTPTDKDLLTWNESQATWEPYPFFVVFGSEYQTDEELGGLGTTSTTPVNVLTLTTLATLPTGVYRIGWNYEWSQDASNQSFKARVRLDDTDPNLMDHSEYPTNSGTSNYSPTGGFAVRTLSAGEHNITLDFWSSSALQASYIWNVRLELWRIS